MTPYLALDRLWRSFRRAKATLFPRRTYELQGFRFAVTNICDARCVFCAYPQARLDYKHMPMDIFTKALDMMAGKITEVDLSPAIGEPLLDPLLEAKARLAKARGYHVYFSTNAIKLARHIPWILDTVDRLQISIPSFNPDLYEEQYGVDRGKQVLDAMWRLLSANDMRGQPVQVDVRVRNRYAPSTERYDKSLFYGRVSVSFTSIWENWSGAVDFTKWSPRMRARIKESPLIKRPCRNLRGALLNPDGTVRLCGCRVVDTDHDDLLIGHVDDGWPALQTAARAKRDQFYQGKFPRICVGCSFYNPE